MCVCMCVDARARKKPRERKDERENKVQKRAGKLKRGGFCPGAGSVSARPKTARPPLENIKTNISISLNSSRHYNENIEDILINTNFVNYFNRISEKAICFEIMSLLLCYSVS